MNIADMDVGQAASGASALMVLATTERGAGRGAPTRCAAVEGIVSVDTL